MQKIIWFKKVKCAGTSIEELLKNEGVIYYVNPRTTAKDLDSPLNKVICIREALFPYGKTRVRYGPGDYRLEGSNLAFEIRRNLGCHFSPRKFMFKAFPDFLQAHAKIAIVRNPFDKFISSWKYLKSTRNSDLKYVINHLPGRRHLHDWVHLTQSQSETVSDLSGNIVVDRIVHMEKHLNDDIAQIFQMLGIRLPELPHSNKSSRSGYEDYLSDDLAERIYSIYRADFENFGYSSDITS